MSDRVMWQVMEAQFGYSSTHIFNKLRNFTLHCHHFTEFIVKTYSIGHGLHPGAGTNGYTEIKCQNLDELSNLGLIAKVIFWVQECHMVSVKLRINCQSRH